MFYVMIFNNNLTLSDLLIVYLFVCFSFYFHLRVIKNMLCGGMCGVCVCVCVGGGLCVWGVGVCGCELVNFW